MTNVSYRLIAVDNMRFLTVYQDGVPHTVTDDTHTNLDEIAEAARNKEDVLDLIDRGRVIQRSFDNVVIGRVAVRDGQVFFDDDPMDSAITKAIVKFLDEGEDVTPLVKFMENVMANPQEHSREQFYRWIEHHNFPIDDDGCIVAYKGVQPDGNGGWQSISSGTAFVNGEKHTGNIPNNPGDIVTMPRSEVEHDPGVACHVGLHAGEWSYASDFARGAVFHVKINPRDVVSVPNDSSSQKVRVCRYEVLDATETEYSGVRYDSSYDEPDEDEPDECDCDDCLEY